MVNTTCLACAKGLRFPESDLGRTIHCPHCGHPHVLVGNGTEPCNHPPRSEIDTTQPFVTNIASVGHETNSAGHGHSFLTSTTPTEHLGPPQSADEIGRLGGYRILGQLGAGGMGVVYLAEDVALKRQIALKVLPARSVSDATARERFSREAQLAANLEHENIITVHQIGEDRGITFLAMPLLKGTPLDRRLRESRGRPLPVADVIEIGRQVARGLSAAHDAGLVHRDIKPANLWIEETSHRGEGEPFRVKILDFGLARPRDSASITQAGVIVGTPSYMSPEQARNPNVDARSDLFSLGCVLYEAATAIKPFVGDDAISVLTSLATDVPIPPVEINAAVPVELSDLIMELLEKNPGQRPASARVVADRLRGIQIGDPLSASERRSMRQRSSIVTPPRNRSPWIWVGVGGGIACAVLVVVAAVAWTSLTTPVVERKGAPKAAKNMGNFERPMGNKKGAEEFVGDPPPRRGPRGEFPFEPKFEKPQPDGLMPALPPKMKKGGKDFGPK